MTDKEDDSVRSNEGQDFRKSQDNGALIRNVKALLDKVARERAAAKGKAPKQ